MTFTGTELLQYGIVLGIGCFLVGLIVHFILDQRAKSREAKRTHQAKIDQDIQTLKMEVFGEGMLGRRYGPSLGERLSAVEIDLYGETKSPPMEFF